MGNAPSFTCLLGIPSHTTPQSSERRDVACEKCRILVWRKRRQTSFRSFWFEFLACLPKIQNWGKRSSSHLASQNLQACLDAGGPSEWHDMAQPPLWFEVDDRDLTRTVCDMLLGGRGESEVAKAGRF